MIVGIHQPAYLPWLGYFDRIRSVDLFIYLDTVQFQKGSFQNRNKVMTQAGPKWLTVPVETAGKLYDTPLKDLCIDASQRWQAKHWSTLKMSYATAPAFRQAAAQIESFYTSEWVRLSDLCWDMLMVFNRLLGIDTKIVRASDLGDVGGQKSDLVLNLCRTVGASTYLSGSQGKNYLDEASFDRVSIAVRYQNFVPKPYRQQANIFVPALGVVDFLFNESEPAQEFAKMGLDGATDGAGRRMCQVEAGKHKEAKNE